jgi:hypothetical protein
MIGYIVKIVKIVDDTSKDQHALISTRRRRHRLDFPIRLPFIQMNQLTSELLLTEIERVLQSNEQFVLDHCVQLNITHVST